MPNSTISTSSHSCVFSLVPDLLGMINSLFSPSYPSSKAVYLFFPASGSMRNKRRRIWSERHSGRASPLEPFSPGVIESPGMHPIAQNLPEGQLITSFTIIMASITQPFKGGKTGESGMGERRIQQSARWLKGRNKEKETWGPEIKIKREHGENL